MKPKNKNLHHLGFIALAFAGFAVTSAQAASQTWTNSASDLLWNTTSADWTGAVWTNNNDAVFGATGVGSIAVASGIIVNDITFSTAGYTLTGDLMLANDQASTFTLNADGTISAILANNTAGASSLIKAGNSTLTLSGANTYSGATTINAGTLTLSGSISSSSALALGGGTLNYTPTTTGSTQTFASAALNAGHSTVTNATGTNTVDLAAITRSGKGLLNISSLAGTTKTSNAVDSTGILGTWVSTGTGTALTYAAGGSGNAITAYTGTAAATATNVTDTTGAANYDVAAVGSLGAGASFNTLRYTGAAGLITGDFTANGLMNAATGTVTCSGNVTIGANKELVILGNTQATTLSGVVSDNGGLASSLTYGGPGAGILALNGANTYTGGTTINSGTITFNNNSAFGTGTITANGGTLREVGPGPSDITTTNNLVVNSATFLDVSGKNWAFSGNLSGSGAITRGTAATLSFFMSGDNSGYTGTFTIQNNGNSIVRFGAASAGSESAKWVVNQVTSSRASIDFGTGTIKFGSLTGTGFFTAANAGTKTIEVGKLGLNETFSGVLNQSGSGIMAVSKVGTGTWTLSGANNYAGATTVTGGILQIGNGTTGSIAGGSALTVDAAGTLALNLPAATTTFANSLTNNGILSTISGNSVTLSGVINGTGSITKAGAGTLTLSGGGDLSGGANISAGTLKFNSSFNNCAVTVGAATLGGNGSVGAVTVNNASAVVTNGNANTNPLTLGSLVFSAGATLNLNKFNDFDTPALVVTGNLTTASGMTLNMPTAPAWSNGTYKLISYGSFTGTVTGPTPHLTRGTITGLGGRQSATLGSTGASNGFITLTIAGDSPYWTGAKDNTWSTAVQTPTKNWRLITTTPITPTDFQTNDQVLFNDNATGSTTVNISAANVQVAGVTFDNTSKNYTISSSGGFGISDFSAPAPLIKNGDGIVTLTTTNSYTGPTTINAGTLQLGDGTTNGDIGNSSSIANEGTLVFNRNGGSFTYGNAISGSGQVIKNGSGAQILTGALTLSGVTTINSGTLQVGNGGLTGSLGTASITNDGSLVFNRTNAVAQSTDFGSIDGTGSVTQAGSGTLTLSSFNSYSGGTTVSAGTLLLGNNAAAGTETITLSGATLGNSVNGITNTNAINVTANSTLQIGSGQNWTLGGNITGSGNINYTPAGNAATLTLGGDNSGYTGTFTQSTANAALQFGSATAGSAAAAWTLNSATASRTRIGGFSGTINFGSLSGNALGVVNNTADTVTISVGALNTSTTFSGTLVTGTGVIALTKVGSGTLTLSGANTYTGDTTVNAGVLAVNGNAIANANKLVVNGGKVDVTGTEVVGTLYFGAAQQASGTWGATGSAATHIDDTHFTGTGVVSVTTGPAGYTTWAATNAPGQTMDQDYDNDGVKNGIEYFMGQTGSTFTANPAAVGGTVTWPMGATYTGVYGTDYLVQSSTDLVNWTQVPVGTGDNTVSVTAGTSVVYDVPTGGKSFVRLVVKN